MEHPLAKYPRVLVITSAKDVTAIHGEDDTPHILVMLEYSDAPSM
jgi:hypothetical protein